MQNRIGLLRTGWRGHLLAAVAGLLITLSLAPFNIWPLAVAGLFLIIFVLHGLTARQAFWRGWWLGLGLFGSGASWVYVSIHLYGGASVLLATFLTLLFCAGIAFFLSITVCLYAGFVRDLPAGTLLGFPAIWVLGEWLRSWLFSGFPWLFVGYSQTEGPLAAWAPVIGVYGISLLLALTAASACHYAVSRQKTGLIGLAACALLWLASIPLATIAWTHAAEKPVSLALVQPNIPQEIKWQADSLKSILTDLEQLTEPLWGADLIVWPEAAVPLLYHQAAGFLNTLSHQADASGSTLITGIPYWQSEQSTPDQTVKGQYFNSVIALGQGSGIYHKQRLVPFGEYVPLENLLRGLIEFFNLPMSSFSAGTGNQPPLHAAHRTLAPSICYEIVYPDLVADSARSAELLITLSNDTWFGKSIGPLQHLQMAQMRAAENGRYVIRATNNGVSAVIDARGHITHRGRQFTREVITAQALPMTGLTPFTRFGSLPIVTLCLAATVLVLLAGRFAHKTPRKITIK